MPTFSSQVVLDDIAGKVKKIATAISEIKSKLRGNRPFIPDTGFAVEHGKELWTQNQALIAQYGEHPNHFICAASMVKDWVDAVDLIRITILDFLLFHETTASDNLLLDHNDLHTSLLGIAEQIRSLSKIQTQALANKGDMLNFLAKREALFEPMESFIRGINIGKTGEPGPEESWRNNGWFAKNSASRIAIDDIAGKVKKIATAISEIKSKLRGNRSFIPDTGFAVEYGNELWAQDQALIAQYGEHPNHFACAAGMVKDWVDAVGLICITIKGFLLSGTMMTKDDILIGHRDAHRSLLAIAQQIQSMPNSYKILLANITDILKCVAGIAALLEERDVLERIENIEKDLGL